MDAPYGLYPTEMFGLLSLARDRAAEPAYRSHRLLPPALSGGFRRSVRCAGGFTHNIAGGPCPMRPQGFHVDCYANPELQEVPSAFQGSSAGQICTEAAIIRPLPRGDPPDRP